MENDLTVSILFALISVICMCRLCVFLIVFISDLCCSAYVPIFVLSEYFCCVYLLLASRSSIWCSVSGLALFISFHVCNALICISRLVISVAIFFLM